MNKEQIIDESYKRYVMLPKELSEVISDNEKFNGRNFTQEEFINKCKTDPEFANKWGLKIEERELSLEERSDLKNSPPYDYGKPANGKLINERLLDSNKVPTKLITITYNNEIIEIYE